MKIKMVADREELVPKYQTAGAAGVDLMAAESALIEPGQTVKVRTGVSLSIPPGYEGQVRPRSGLAFRYGITVLNAPGTIDSDYRGEICVLLHNTGADLVGFSEGDRIAQLVIAPVTQAEFVEVATLSETKRGDGGFGSTG